MKLKELDVNGSTAKDFTSIPAWKSIEQQKEWSQTGKELYGVQRAWLMRKSTGYGRAAWRMSTVRPSSREHIMVIIQSMR